MRTGHENTARRWRITDVRQVDHPAEDAWLITYQPLDGDPADAFVSYVPTQAFEARAAEYGLHDIDEVLEVILHEPLLGPAQAAGELSMLTPAMTDQATARAQLHAQLSTCKTRYGTVEPAPVPAGGRGRAADPLQAIRATVRLDAVRIAALRVEMDRYRLATPVAPPSAAGSTRRPDAAEPGPAPSSGPHQAA